MRYSWSIIIVLVFVFCSCVNYGIVDNKFRTNCFGNITPCSNNTYDLGSATNMWHTVWAVNSVGGTGSNVTTTGGTLNRLAKFLSGNVIGNSQVYDNSTYVGISTVNPVRKLTVHDGSGNQQVRISYTGGLLYTDLESDHFGYFIIDPTGKRVGINDYSPSEALDVDGNAHLSGNLSIDGACIKSNSISARDLVIDTGAGKTLVFEQNIYDDLRTPVTAIKTGGVHDPGFSVFKTNGAGSQGVYCYWFDAGTEEELFFTVQMPHGYKLNTTIVPHIHWIPKTGGAGNVRWGLEYIWADIGTTYGNTTLIYGSTHTPADAPLIAGRHYYTPTTTITPPAGAGAAVGSMLVCRIFRDATNGADTYGDDAGMLEVDFHYAMDTIGSRTENAK